MPRSILVTGATGKQGGAVVKALLASPRSQEFTIYALTRSTDSPSAKKLAAKGDNVKLIQGDLDHVVDIFHSASEPFWGVFSMQTAIGKGGVESEERQGIELVEAALAHGTKHFVYSSVDRGGDKSIDTPTDIPHFISKHNIEKHLIARAGGRMSWTILRPVAFMDNFTPDFFGKVLPTAWKNVLQDKPLQLVAVKDIGRFAAKAFLEPEAFDKRAISLAGDELTFDQMNKIFKEKTGQDAPTTYGFLVSIILWMSKEFGNMVRWFKSDGYGASIAACKAEVPELLDFATYLETESAWKKS